MTNLGKLNNEQKKAAIHTEGPLLILAGAGSGKTSTMTHRIAYLVEEKGVNPYSILAVTFTNKAAGEMRDRVEALVGGHLPAWIMTFHAACLRVLRRHAEVLGYTNSFVVYDSVDTKAAMKAIIRELKVDDKQFSVNGMLAIISECKEKEISPQEYVEIHGGQFREETIGRIFSEYERVLKKNNAMDFDDLLLNTVRLFRKDPQVLEQYQERFQYIMVDEYQDTNQLQYEFVRMLAENHRNLCVVGDDDQCIYQWRGADIRNILEFEKDFRGAKVVKLEQNYRSTGNILAAAHSVIQNNRGRKAKKLWTDAQEGHKIIYRRADDEKEEAYYIAQEIDRLRSSYDGYNDFAVLYRTNAQSRNFEEALSARSIPYRVVGGIRYYDRKEIKDIVAYMRLVLNPYDDLSLRRVINEPKRGVGATTVEKLSTLAEVRGENLFHVLMDEEVMASLSTKARTGLGEMMVTVAHYHDEADNLRVSDIYDGLLTGTGYVRALESAATVEADGRLENLLEFKSVILQYEKEGELSLAVFLEKIALLSDVDNHKPDEDAVALMTLHSAKGLEFPVVFMPGMEDGLFPGWRSMEEQEKMEEERRLCYVGMTRAKDRLYLTSAGYRVLYGKGDYTRESTFLRELDPKLIDGDGVYVKKAEVRLGEEKPFDGYSKPTPFAPFDRFAVAKKEVQLKKNMETFAPGDKVSHGKFGEGMVVEVKGNVVSVMFDSVGKKKLASDVAPIKKV